MRNPSLTEHLLPRAGADRLQNCDCRSEHSGRARVGAALRRTAEGEHPTLISRALSSQILSTPQQSNTILMSAPGYCRDRCVRRVVARLHGPPQCTPDAVSAQPRHWEPTPVADSAPSVRREEWTHQGMPQCCALYHETSFLGDSLQLRACAASCLRGTDHRWTKSVHTSGDKFALKCRRVYALSGTKRNTRLF